MELDAKAWQAFAITAEVGSISQAARKLKCSHSTLSRQIANLEDELGYDLFIRNGTGKKLDLTTEGLLLLDKASIAIQTLTELNVQAMHIFEEEVPRKITFAIPDIVPQSLETSLANAIWEQWPAVELTFRKPSLFESLKLCSQNKVDFAIICQEQKRVTRLRTETIGDEKLVILASPSHQLASTENLAVESLTPHRLFYPIVGNSGLSSLESDHYSINNCFVQNFRQGIDMAAKGLGVTFAPLHLAQRFIDKNLLVILPVFTSLKTQEMRLELAYVNNYPYKEVAEFVLQHVITHYKESA